MADKHGWRVEFFTLPNGHIPVEEYLETLDKKHRAKIISYIELLRSMDGRFYEPYAKHVQGSIWELRVDLGRRASRLFYFLAREQRIVMLHAFTKKSQKTPRREMERALKYRMEYGK